MASIFEQIFGNVITVVTDAVVEAGYPEGAVRPDEWGLEAFPPQTTDQLTGGCLVVIRGGTSRESEVRVTNYDRWDDEISIGVCLANTSTELELRQRVKRLQALIVKRLREDLTRGGKATNTWKFSIGRWASGDGQLAGGDVEFTVQYMTAYNNPDSL